MTEKRYWIYRVYDGNERLLYVGMTRSFYQRVGAHEKTAQWWPKARRIKRTLAGSRERAVALEAIAIHNEAPLFNKTYQLGWTKVGNEFIRHPTISLGVQPLILNALQEDADALGVRLAVYLEMVLNDWYFRWRKPRGSQPKRLLELA